MIIIEDNTRTLGVIEIHDFNAIHANNFPKKNCILGRTKIYTADQSILTIILCGQFITYTATHYKSKISG